MYKTIRVQQAACYTTSSIDRERTTRDDATSPGAVTSEGSAVRWVEQWQSVVGCE